MFEKNIENKKEQKKLNDNTENDKSVKSFIFNLYTNISNDNIGVYSGQATFFMVLSFFPILMLFLNIISHTSFIPNYLIPNYIERYLPDALQEYLLNIIDELQRSSSSTLFSVSVLLAIWAASKGAMAVIMCLRLALKSDKSTNWIFLRVLSVFYTILLLFILTLSMILLVFGNSIFWNLASKNPILYNISNLYSITRYLLVLVILILFFAVIYKIGANKELKFIDMIPGSLFTTVGWMIFSFMFSIYVENISNFSYMYGSIAGIIIIMMWLYICMFIMFIGAEINTTLYEMKTNTTDSNNTSKIA